MLSYASGLGLARENSENMCAYPRIYAYILRRGVKLGHTSHTKPAFFFVSQITLYPSTGLRPITLKPGDVLDHGIAWRVAVVMMAAVVMLCW